LPADLLLHTGASVTWSAWTFDPTVIGGALIGLGSYFFVCDHFMHRVQALRALSFIAGLLFVVIALVSPLDAAAGRLLCMHMLQHVLLTTIGPPLILLGLPPALLGGILRQGPARPLRLLTNPVLAGALFVINMWIWHVPPVYELALNHHDTVHAFMHMTFLITGLLFWWPVIQPLPQPGSLGDGARLLYLFATGMPMSLLALLLLASNGVVYSYYAQPPYLWGISPLPDQQVGGLIMGALGEAAAFIAVTLLFFRFLDRDQERETGQQPGPLDAA
jgi:putative membrane protein